jgi:hypothetical protein
MLLWDDYKCNVINVENIEKSSYYDSDISVNHITLKASHIISFYYIMKSDFMSSIEFKSSTNQQFKSSISQQFKSLINQYLLETAMKTIIVNEKMHFFSINKV